MIHYTSGIVYDQTLIVFALHTHSSLAVLCSRLHESWALFLGGSMKDDPRYNVDDCFKTFPFPAGFETNAALEAAGREYYESRAALMQDLWLGLTEIYNLFHSPDDEALARLEALYRKRAAFSSPSPREARAGRGPGRGASGQSASGPGASSPQPSPPSDGGEGVKTPSDWRAAEAVPADRSPLTLYATPAAALAGVQRLRALHAAMDAAVLTAYGWTDLLPKCACEFLLDYEEDEDAEERGVHAASASALSSDLEIAGASSSPALKRPEGRAPGRKKKPWRYRWPDEIRDEVLARLLKLNAERAEEEKLAGAAAAAAAPGKVRKPRVKKSTAGPAQEEIIPSPQKDLFG